MNPVPRFSASLTSATVAPVEGFTAATSRISAIKAELLSTPYSICLERPKLLEEFLSSKDGRLSAKLDHPLIHRARALHYLYSHRMPRIYADELIIGNMTSKRIAANYYIEGGSINILEDIARLGKRAVPLKLSVPETAELLRIGLKNAFKSVGAKALLRPGRLSYFLDFFRAKRHYVTEEAGIGHQVGNYWMVVNEGLVRPYEEAKSSLEEGRLANGSPIDADQRAFFSSVLITIDGIRKMAENLAERAELEAKKPGLSEQRRAELLESARVCRRVPFEPARTYLEGLQAVWLVHVALNLEDFEQGLSFGRMDQILLPLYRSDVEQCRLTPEQATEMTAGFCLKTCETMPLYSQRIDQFFSGNGVAQAFTLGGTDEKGNDVTNEVSGLILDAYAQVLTREPAVHVRIHPTTPEWFFNKSVELLQMGTSRPSFFGDLAVVRALEEAGMTEAHARDYAIIGCVEMASQGRTYNSSDAALFNLPFCLELALNEGARFNGKARIEGPRRFGAATPPVSSMKTFEDILEAFRAQVRHGVDDMVKVIGWMEEVYRDIRPTPVNSILTDGCLDSGKDVTWGGGLYDFTSVQAAGLADAGDSLYALKKIVFDEKRFSLEEFVRILRENYKGREDLRIELATRLPRYGNGDPEVDRMTQLAADAFADAVWSHKNTRGGQYVPGFYSMTCHLGFGRMTGALPNGRPAGRRLSNGLAPADGSERMGPTAVLRSAASLDSRKWMNCYALNLKFDKKIVQGKTGRKALVNLFKNYFTQGGMQVQVNILDTETLKAAKKDPASYPGIVVRVAGYCAYFNDLQPDVQDEIIERTAHG
ncbi:MAG TPA: pyruvate formate lyase family protein, partial [Desulfomonilia bacterium]|nr:pyruvate formate lyase family protein [Desulfomonilia bacterium]